MKFTHRNGETATGAVTLTPVRDNAAVDENGVFEVDEGREDFDEVRETLVEAGHDPLEADSDDDGDDGGDGDGGDIGAVDAPNVVATDEDTLVEMGRNELRSIAAQYDDIDGNASADALTEALIEKRREETEGE